MEELDVDDGDVDVGEEDHSEAEEEDDEGPEVVGTFSNQEHAKKLIQMVNTTQNFRYTVNYFYSPDLVPYFWAAINEYFQEVCEAFVISDGWGLKDFARTAEEKQLYLVFRCAYTTKGLIEHKAKHFKLVCQILLEASKFQWLAPWKTRNTFGLSTCIKRQIGGFFLSYFLLMKQPEPTQGVLSTEKQKMSIDPDDSRTIRFFISDLDKVENEGLGRDLKKEVKLAFLKLHHKNLFEKNMRRNEYGLDSPILFLNGVKSDSRLNYFGLLKDIRDKLLYMTYQGIGNTVFREMLQVAHSIFDRPRRKNNPRRKKLAATESKFHSDSVSSNTTLTKIPPVVTFQTRLRQRLDQQFRQMHMNYSVPPSPSPPPCSMPLNDEDGTTESTFPPPRKTNWTVDDVQALRKERDLAVIAFRVVEILRCITPSNPLSSSRLINELQSVQNTKGAIRKYEDRGNVSHENRLQCASRLSRLSKKGMHRFIRSNETRFWMEYLKGPSKPTVCDAAEMLDKLKTHEVVATDPNLVFRPREIGVLPSTSDQGEGFDCDFGFPVDEDQNPWEINENERLQLQLEHSEEVESAQSQSTLEFLDNTDVDMPDLNTFWEEQLPDLIDDDEPPKLSPFGPLLVENENMSSCIASLETAQQQRRPWFILATPETMEQFASSIPKEIPPIATTNNTISPHANEMSTTPFADGPPTTSSPKKSKGGRKKSRGRKKMK